MKPILLFVFLFSGLFSSGQSKQVCFTIDDLPVVSYGLTDTVFLKNLTDHLILALTKNQIPAIGFVNERKLYDSNVINPFQVRLLNEWVENKLELGNHTYSHPDYNSVSYQDFTSDLLKGDIITRELLQNHGESLKYFRHPFLHVGPTKSKADSLDAFLLQHGYKTAPVTIDNEDYLFALAYHRTYLKRDTLIMKQIGIDYVSYMERKVKYFEKQSVALFGREIRQILVLHASLLNSDYVGPLAAMFRQNGYAFINLDKTLEDIAYQTEITAFGKWGITWLDKWAMTQGKKGDFFREEPATPQYIRELSK
jgi:peptidoglycan/xylan/chitin deacetylase (PgdA/CDA1 family)